MHLFAGFERYEVETFDDYYTRIPIYVEKS